MPVKHMGNLFFTSAGPIPPFLFLRVDIKLQNRLVKISNLSYQNSATQSFEFYLCAQVKNLMNEK